jgi:hypothetical protein
LIVEANGGMANLRERERERERGWVGGS